MNVFAHFHSVIAEALAALGAADASRVSVEPPRDPAHGDIATNAAMVLSRALGTKPRDLAERLAERLRGHPDIVSVEIAGPGFINLRLADSFWQARLADVLSAGTAYGVSRMGGCEPVNVEFVSANPTGPLHVGHGRGAVFGDVLASLLAKAGYAVTREYYINDAGAQVDVLARSAYQRYLQALGRAEDAIPEGLYPGDYLIPIGQTLAMKHGEQLVGRPETEWLEPVRELAVAAMMDLIRDDLAAIGIRHDVFSSERALVAAGRVGEVLASLDAQGHIYNGVLEPPKGKLPDDWEPRPQTLFRSTSFGDDVDRPLRKSDSSWTYFATDIAYHLDKIRRGFNTLIDVWGADHGGYVKRMAAAVKAASDGGAALDVKLCQLVRILRNGELVRMSKRAGDFITLRDVVDEVGPDVVRFIMLTRKNDAALDFDLAKVVEQSRDNPVFYVQYAHARVASVFRNAAEILPGTDLSPAALASVPFITLTHPDELALVRQIASWPWVIEGAAAAHEPHRIAFYLYELSAQFHALWNKGREDQGLRFILPEQRELSLARLALLRSVATVIASGLDIFGITPAEEMR